MKDNEETVSEDDLPAVVRKPQRDSMKNTRKSVPVKAKPTVAKQKKKSDDMTDLISQIKNKRRGGANVLNDLGARYGVDLKSAEEDPLGNDEGFGKYKRD